MAWVECVPWGQSVQFIRFTDAGDVETVWSRTPVGLIPTGFKPVGTLTGFSLPLRRSLRRQLLAQLIEPAGSAQHPIPQTKRGPLGLVLFGAPGRIRTYDPRFRRPVL